MEIYADDALLGHVRWKQGSGECWCFARGTIRTREISDSDDGPGKMKK